MKGILIGIFERWLERGFGCKLKRCSKIPISISKWSWLSLIAHVMRLIEPWLDLHFGRDSVRKGNIRRKAIPARRPVIRQNTRWMHFNPSSLIALHCPFTLFEKPALNFFSIYNFSRLNVTKGDKEVQFFRRFHRERIVKDKNTNSSSSCSREWVRVWSRLVGMTSHLLCPRLLNEMTAFDCGFSAVIVRNRHYRNASYKFR